MVAPFHNPRLRSAGAACAADATANVGAFDPDERMFASPRRPSPDASQAAHPPAGPSPAPQPSAQPSPPSGPRLRLLMTEDRRHADEHWTHQVPRLLGPLGVEAARVSDGSMALSAARQIRFDIAVIDLATPAGAGGSMAPPASGLWLLEVLSRMEAAPATVVINAATAPRQAERLLLASLRLGASAVIPRPVELNTLLEAIRRVLRRGHQDRWPSRPPSPPAG